MIPRTSALIAATLLIALRAHAQSAPLVRLAEIEVDPAQLAAYKAALTEEIEASLRLEPGVLTLLAVAIKDQPTRIRLFETYAGPAAYQAHIASPHFLKYKAVTRSMVKSLVLLETDPILLGLQKR